MTSAKRHRAYRWIAPLLGILLLTSPLSAFGLFDAQTPDGEIGSLKQGTRFLGASVSLKSRESENPSDIFQEIASVDQTTYKINAYGGYFIRDLWALGASLNYNSMEKDSGFSGDGDKSRIEYLNRFTSLGVLMRNYLPIDSSGRFSLFVETSLDVGYGKEVIQTTLADDINRKVTHFYICDVGVTPGIMAFIDNGVGIEASVNIMGLTSRWGDFDFNDGERTGDSSSVDLDFTVKLLTLYIGITYYF